MNENIALPKDKIADFCQRRHIRWLAVLLGGMVEVRKKVVTARLSGGNFCVLSSYGGETSQK